MDTRLAPSPQTGLEIADLKAKAADYARAAVAPATVRAYAKRLRAFGQWCEARGLSAMPASPEAVALYLTDRAGQGEATATLALALSALSQANIKAGFPSPRLDPGLRSIWAGIVKSRAAEGDAQRQARALDPGQLRRMVKTGRGLVAVRDRALLLLGFASGCRRSELAALNVGDVEETPEGLIVRIGRSKTDQAGKGREIGIPHGSGVTCPVRAWQAWRAEHAAETGPAFVGVQYGKATASRLDGGSIARAVKRAAKRAGLRGVAEISGHSLRAGLCTAAAKAGKSSAAIKAQTGHRSDASLARYIRRGTIFEDNAADGIGL